MDSPSRNQQQTAKKALAFIEGKNPRDIDGANKLSLLTDLMAARFVVANKINKPLIATAFAANNKVVYGKAFDTVIQIGDEFDLTNREALNSNIHRLYLCEIKSTNKRLNDSFDNYFFALTTAELLVAQSLGEHFLFLFVNTETGAMKFMRLQDVFARAKSIYPTWSIRFGVQKIDNLT